jgi:hypothetical protein
MKRHPHRCGLLWTLLLGDEPKERSAWHLPTTPLPAPCTTSAWRLVRRLADGSGRPERRRRGRRGSHPALQGGQHRLGPLDPLNLAGGTILLAANKGRVAGQVGVAATSTVKTALTVAALGITAYARVLGKKLEHAGDVPVEGGTTPNPTTPDEVTRAQRQLTALQWVIPVLTGAVLVVNARMGEQQRPTQVSKGLVRRLLPGR